jgi:hypothetical protein
MRARTSSGRSFSLSLPRKPELVDASARIDRPKPDDPQQPDS